MTYDFDSKLKARKLLKAKGSKVAIQIGFDGPFVFCEKGDFINVVLEGDGTFADYDGNPRDVWHKNNVLYIPIGVY